MISARAFWLTGVFLTVGSGLLSPSTAWSEAEVKFDRGFLAGVIEKMPPVPFQKEGKYRGTVHSFRLQGIDPKARRILVSCQVEGEFHPPLPKPRGANAPEIWRSFRFEVRVGINVEPGNNGAPRFDVDVEDVKRRELEGVTGTLAKFMGRSFDAIVLKAADGKASQMNDKLNAEIVKRVQAFQDYGVFCRIDYAPAQIVLHFDVTRYLSKGITGYLFPTPQPGTVPLNRWVHVRRADHVYTTGARVPDPRLYRADGIAGYVFDHPQPETVALHGWFSKLDHFYTTAPDGEGAYRRGYKPDGIACHLYANPQPGTIPFYRFIEPRYGLHFYTTHPNAEFAK